jgi:hypothetical protein
MTKIKETQVREIPEIPLENAVEESVFPETYIMNEWSYNPHSRDSELHFDRSRETLDIIYNNDSDYYIPSEWWPAGFQVAFMNEYVLGVPQADNLRRRQRKGWEFVHESEMPQLKMELMNHDFDRNRSDHWIRMGGHILMKKPMDDYLKEQEEKRRQGEEIRRQSEATAQFLSSGRDPRYIIENKKSYQPAHRMGRR